jgi:hypothetical protein
MVHSTGAGGALEGQLESDRILQLRRDDCDLGLRAAAMEAIE